MRTSTLSRPAEVTVGFESVTPADAARWLGQMPRNRRIHRNKLALYVRDMLAGSWRDTGEALKFTVDGTLIDGQHRLLAIKQTGVTLRLLVVRGLEAEAQDVMDTGAPRSAADMHHLHDEKNTALLAAAIRLAAVIGESGYTASTAGGVTHAESLAWLKVNPDMRHAVDRAGTFGRQIDARSKAAVAYALFRLRRIDAFETEAFILAATESIGLQPGDPVIAMRRRFAEARRNSERLTVNEELSVIFRAWNARRDGKALSRIQISRPVVVQDPR